MIIYFNQIFIKDLCKCYLGPHLCCAVRSIDSMRTNYTAIWESCWDAVQKGTINAKVCPRIPYEKLNLIQAQLGCAVGMLISCAIYVVLYFFACFGICFGHK